MNHQPQLIRLSDGHVFDLHTETRIGRRDDCNIVLEESGVSRFHAQINVAGNKIKIEDHSRNGTDVNGSAINDVTVLYHQDIIRFDKDEYQLDYPGATADPAENNSPEPPSFAAPDATQIAEDALRKPLPARPLDEGTQVVLPNTSGQYQQLDYQRFSGPSLVVRNGNSADTNFPLLDTDNRWTIGSSDSTDIRIEDVGVSQQHAVIQRSGNSWEVTDQMATNVLRVNGNLTNKCFLKNGDMITLGATDCEFVLPKGYRVSKQKKHNSKSRTRFFMTVAVFLIVAITVGIYLASNFVD